MRYSEFNARVDKVVALVTVENNITCLGMASNDSQMLILIG